MESRIENWTCLLSREVVNYWLNNQEAELPDLEESITSLGLAGGVNSNQLFQALEQGEGNLTLLQELQKFLERVQENYSSEPNSLEKLLKIESALFNWYYGNSNESNSSGCLQKLGIKSQVLRVETRKKFQDLVEVIWLGSSPQAGFNYLSRIGALLFNLTDQYKTERHNCIVLENGGKKPYAFLVSKIIKSQDESEVNNNYNSGINALLHIYRCKIRGEIADLASQIIRGVIQDYQLISESLIQTTSFLNNLQDSLTQKEEKINLTVALFFEEMHSVKSPNKLKEELENSFGIPLNRWGSCSYISVEEVKKILLEEVVVITEDIYKKEVKKITSSKLNQEQDKPFQILTSSYT